MLQRQQKSISYYALDISPTELVSNIRVLADQFPKSSGIQCIGLLGTYEDGISWFSKVTDLYSKTVHVLWFGNSIANLPLHKASGTLRRFVSSTKAGCPRSINFIVAIDGCRDTARIRRAYDPKNPLLRAFILNGLQQANRVLENDVFRPEDWDYIGVYDEQQSAHQDYYVASKNLVLDIAGTHIHIRENERVGSLQSAKWAEEDVRLVAHEANLEVAHCWKDIDESYGEFKCRSRENLQYPDRCIS
jgi:EasF-like predicted methyltransferase